MKRWFVFGGSLLVAVGFLASRNSKRVIAQTARDIPPLQLEEQIPVPGVAGRLDHFTVDAKRRRLFVSALGNNTVEVIDVFAGRVIHSITAGLPSMTFVRVTDISWHTPVWGFDGAAARHFPTRSRGRFIPDVGYCD